MSPSERILREIEDLDRKLEELIKYAEADVLRGAVLGHELRKLRTGEIRTLLQLAQEIAAN